jgi:oxygen-independent coproporphyrinogen-3 oxidase
MSPSFDSDRSIVRSPDSAGAMARSADQSILGLYLHIPFCSAICNYCNFNRGLFDPDQKQRYVSALASEIGRVGDANLTGARGRAADSIYFGGGTPSLLEPHEIRRLIEACHGVFTVAPEAEITLEANPESVTAERLAAYRAAGVNRLSFGVQSFRDDELRRLSRLHTVSRARAAFGEARAAGFTNISIDLMMWLPEQPVLAWLESVEAAIALGSEHVSMYLLEIYPNAPLREDMARGRWSQAPDDDAAEMYMAAMERLELAGYRQYEISNVAKPGREARHNLKYWTDGEWLGFGCGAHSTYGDRRWKNLSATEEYIARLDAATSTAVDVRVMNQAERLGDALFTGLRLTDGIDLDLFEQRYGVDVWRRYEPELRPFADEGLVRNEHGRLRLTRRGMLLAHEIMAVFV